MTRITLKRIAAATVISLLSLPMAPASALATTKAAAAANTHAAADTAQVQRIITRGNNEIARRLTTLNKLSDKVNSSTKLSAADKASLNSEISGEISNLTSLKTKLDADTTVSDARTDAQSIITGYRVYALIIPKVNLVKTADDQQVAEAKLSALILKFQTRINAAKSAGKNVTALQNALAAMNAKTSAAQAISSNIETSVISLQPSDYNSNHSVLSGNRDQLKTAQANLKAAVQASSTIVNGLKNL